MKPTEALIFDFDGLLLDTETPDFDVLATQYRAHGVELSTERWIQGLGTVGGFEPYHELESLIGKVIDHEALRVAHRESFLAACANQSLRPGVIALLEAAQQAGLALAVASSASSDWVEGWLARHTIRRYFRCVRTRNDVARVKPAPDLFLSAAECLGVPPECCVVFEDSLHGMQAAATAGMRCVAVTIDMLAHIDVPPVTMRLRSLADLPASDLLKKLS